MVLELESITAESLEGLIDGVSRESDEESGDGSGYSQDHDDGEEVDGGDGSSGDEGQTRGGQDDDADESIPGGTNFLALPREALQVGRAWIRHGIFGMPYLVTKSVLRDPALEGPLSDSRFLDLFGQNAIGFFSALGPIYGKAGQTILSRLPPSLHDVAVSLRLNRLYKDWPPLDFQQVQGLLDAEIPHWRGRLRIESHPVGVASLAQVHGAKDEEGREWVVKILRPNACKRLHESVQAMEQVMAVLEPLAVTLVAKRLLREMGELCDGFRREVDLANEAEMIGRVQEKIAGRRQKLLVIPEVHEDFCTSRVLVIERFRGTPLADIVAGHVELPKNQRAKLAKSMLHEMLVQVFELGLFHADPHAGNLMLLEDGSVGLYDWGLTGELLESDRRHIAAILKAVMALDLDQLVKALQSMAEEGGRSLDDKQVKKELGSVIRLIKKGRADPTAKPSLQQLFEACLKAAARLGIPVPDGLLMMAKCLITIEGLAKGIDPKISMARVATPVLFRAARPGLKDLFAMGRRLPQVAKTFFPRGDSSSGKDSDDSES